MATEFVELENEMGRPIEGYLRRMLLLHRINEAGHGVVDGVEIDLRHPSLPTETWVPDYVFGMSPHGRDGPILIFPWSLEDWGILPPRRLRPLTLRQGDRVRVIRVTSHRFAERELSHPADREFREAYFVIERASGRRAFVAEPMRYWPRLSLSRPYRAGRPTFDRIVARICEELGVSHIDSFMLTSEELTFPEAAFDAASAARMHGELLEKSFAALDDDSRETVRIYLNSLIDDAVAVGYYAAQAEAEAFMQPRAQRDLDRATASGDGGRRSGATRRRKASIWRACATELIQELLLQPGPHKKEAIVADVQAGWRWPSVKPPGDRSLWGLLNDLEDEGVISLDGR